MSKNFDLLTYTIKFANSWCHGTPGGLVVQLMYQNNAKPETFHDNEIFLKRIEYFAACINC